MGIFEKNIATLYKLNPKYQEKLEEERKKDKKEFQVSLVESRDGAKAVVVETEEQKVRLNSAYQPLKEAKKWADQFAFQNLQVNVILFGMGNGIFVRELLSRMGDDARIFVYEPDFRLLGQLMEEVDYTDILSDSRLRLMLGVMGKGVLKYTLHPYVNWATIPTQIICSHPGYEKIYREEKTEYWQMLTRVIEVAKVNRNTNAHFSHLILENALPNIAHIQNSNHLKELVGILSKDMPAFVVSAGPSLEKNAEELKRAKGKALIIAVDTAVRHLEKRGIEYDCIVTVDPEKPTEYFTDAPGCREKPLFCGMSSNKGILAFHQGRKIWHSGDIILARLYSKYGIEVADGTAGGSVATLALLIAANLGTKRVILVGQDLAYGDSGSHVGGEQSSIKGEQNQNIWVDGVDGNQVRTRWDWKYYKEWFEEAIQVQENLELIDATEGGALIHGSQVMKLSEAIDKYCTKDFDFEKVLEEIPPTFDEKQYGEVRKTLLHIEKEMSNIHSRAKKGIAACKEYLDTLETMSLERHMQLLKDINKANRFIMLQDQAADLLDIYTSDLAMSELTELNKITGDERQDELNSVKNAKIIYGAYVEGAEELSEILKQALMNV